MSDVYICGLGAVSPAGWGVPSLSEALDKGEPLPIQPLERPGWAKPLRARPVPNAGVRPAFVAHPRLRRSSPLTLYATAAALEALRGLPPAMDGRFRLGLVVSLQNGCVQYTYKFFDEALKDPATASPLLFPETVHAAPASHIAALLGNTPVVYTFVGDPTSFVQGLSVAADWLEESLVDACLVIGAEEINWLSADALWHLDRSAVIAGGAGALCLSRDPKSSLGVRMAAITDSHTYSACFPRLQAARAMREQLGGSGSELLCDGLGGSARADAPEAAAWSDWTGPRLSLKRILGEGLMAGAAWQCVAACDAVARGQFRAANVSLVGGHQQAIGARFVGAGQPSSAT